MMEPWLLFIPACLALNLTPGPDVLFILSQALGARRGGLWATLGLGLSYLGHTLLAVVGLSALVMQSATAFTLIKYLGAAYLLYLGWSSLHSASRLTMPAAAEDSGTWRIFRRGLMVGLLNPKVALFFLAFLPQFVVVNAVPVPQQLLLLGLAFTLTATLCNGGYALMARVLQMRIKGSPGFSRITGKLSGLIMMGLGVRLALAKA
ncbi:LysE family translocator [Zobellella maritima]|uniref:LysE family translocator n=1 Tax=Zobellella maritima TaxID=2059725 RepID=UPI001E37A537|nr:LysE family translocator [Zobellella maritima]